MFISNSTAIISSHLGLFSNVTQLCTSTASSNCSARTSAKNVPESGSFDRGYAAYLQLGAHIFIDVLGFVGNGLVLGVVALCKEMRTVANYFIVSLSVADLLVCLIVVPLLIFTHWNKTWSLGETVCDFLAIINVMCTAASLFSLAAVAVNRVVITRHPGKYAVLFSESLSKIYIAITWFFALLYALLPAIGWGEYEFDDMRFVCLFSLQAAPGYSVFIGICCVLISQFMCGICYLMILVTFKRSRENLHQIPDVEGDLGENVYAISAWMMFANSCINPVIYGAFNRKFRSAYIQLIKKTPLTRRCWKCRVEPMMQQPGSPRLRPNQGISRPNRAHSLPPSTNYQLRSGIERLEIPKRITVRGSFIAFEENI